MVGFSYPTYEENQINYKVLIFCFHFFCIKRNEVFNSVSICDFLLFDGLRSLISTYICRYGCGTAKSSSRSSCKDKTRLLG